MGMISVCRSYFLLVVVVVVWTVVVVVTLVEEEIVGSVTTVEVEVEVCLVVPRVVDVRLGLVVLGAVQSTLPAWSQVISLAEYRVPGLQVLADPLPPTGPDRHLLQSESELWPVLPPL